jgi:cell division protein FtsZ
VELKRPEKIVFDLNAEVVAPVKNDVPTQPLVNVAPANEMHNVADSMEPVLIVREEVSFEVSDVSSFEEFVENQIEAEEQSHVLEMELPLDMEPTIIERNPVVPPVNADLFSMDEPEIRHSMDHIERHELEEETLSPEQEMFKRSRERILRLKEINHKMSSPNGINDLEREPAYKRRNVKLENVPNSADSSISRYTLSIDENDKKPELRANNSFLHDRVD